jgi:hypothetical protein
VKGAIFMPKIIEKTSKNGVITTFSDGLWGIIEPQIVRKKSYPHKIISSKANYKSQYILKVFPLSNFIKNNYSEQF